MTGTRRAPPHRRGGFTLIEVLAALLFLAMVVPAIVTGLTISNRAAETAERATIAGRLAENKLNELLIGDAWQSATNNKGDFSPAWPGYRWESTQPEWSADSANAMTQLRVEVFFTVQGREHSVVLTTLVNTLASTQNVLQGGGMP